MRGRLVDERELHRSPATEILFSPVRMSASESFGYISGLDLADRCNTPVLADILDEHDLLGYGPLIDGTLTERDTDRVRIAKFIASKPEGVPLKHVVSYTVKAVSPEACERVDGSDPDYQFVYRFIQNFAEPQKPYVQKSESSGVLFVTPLRLLDLTNLELRLNSQ